MKTRLVALLLAGATAAALPAAADPGRGHGKEKGARHHVAQAGHCPPGLAKKDPPCVPPGQARQAERQQGTRVGEVLRIGDYRLIRDPSRYQLERRDGWRYYRDDSRAYRVDPGTNRILAVLELVNAFTN